MKTEASEVIQSIANKATIVGSITAVLGNLSATDIAAYGGLLLALFGFITNMWYKYQDNKFRIREDHRREKEHLIRVAEFNRRIGLPDTRPEGSRTERRCNDD